MPLRSAPCDGQANRIATSDRSIEAYRDQLFRGVEEQGCETIAFELAGSA